MYKDVNTISWSYSGDGYFIKSIGAKHTTNPQTIGYSRLVAALKAFFNGTAAATFPGLLTGAANLEWGKK